MNWKLIFQLSLFALAMGIGTVFLIPSNIEPLFWLVIFLICAYVIAKRAPKNIFLHGLVLGLVNCVWVTGAHIFFSSQYLASHAREAAMMNKMPMPDSPRLMMAMVGPVVGVISGIAIGILAFVASKIFKPASAS